MHSLPILPANKCLLSGRFATVIRDVICERLCQHHWLPILFIVTFQEDEGAKEDVGTETGAFILLLILMLTLNIIIIILVITYWNMTVFSKPVVMLQSHTHAKSASVGPSTSASVAGDGQMATEEELRDKIKDLGKPLMIYANAQTTDCTPASADSSLIFTFKGDVGRRKNK
ncbi:hypothetical protein F2P81_018701 [Scophthalmus maximus]|uniref:Uncharacterized protein n=1 Tax=Scophthalmus maximus TaxID=52904 RepID=A0A6A4S311_SCOMX|nr:hypothetical protein F2P81_018701 [Scophthalmus maximus]